MRMDTGSLERIRQWTKMQWTPFRDAITKEPVSDGYVSTFSACHRDGVK